MGIRNFGTFFKDQISHCDAIFLSHVEDIQQRDLTIHMLRDIAPHTPIHKEPWDSLSLKNYIHRLYHCDNPIEDTTHPFMSHTFKNLRTLTPDTWHTVFQHMPYTMLRAKGIIPTTEGPMEVQYTTTQCEFIPTKLTDYSLVMIGTEFDIPHITNEVCLP